MFGLLVVVCLLFVFSEGTLIGMFLVHKDKIRAGTAHRAETQTDEDKKEDSAFIVLVLVAILCAGAITDLMVQLHSQGKMSVLAIVIVSCAVPSLLPLFIATMRAHARHARNARIRNDYGMPDWGR